MLLIATAAPGLAAAAAPRAAFDQMQQQFMCTACHEALNVARSPEAFNENQYLRHLVKLGETPAQIRRDMVGQYGTAVLAKPPAHGFGLLVYVIPAAVVLLGLAFVGFTVPRWRRQSRAAAEQPLPAGPALSDDDAQRLDADLARRT
jgi:cytochrome c-type biogenesis protein CcmH